MKDKERKKKEIERKKEKIKKEKRNKQTYKQTKITNPKKSIGGLFIPASGHPLSSGLQDFRYSSLDLVN